MAAAIDNKVLAGFGISSLALAYLGNRLVDAALAYRDPIEAMFEDALLDLPSALLARPFWFSPEEPAVLGALIGFILPWIAFLLVQESLLNIRRGDEQGSAYAGTVKDGQVYKDVKDPDNNIILTKNLGVAIKPSDGVKEKINNRNILVVGGSGSGKTAGFVEPNVMQLGVDRDVVVIDPKGTVLDRVGMTLVTNGWDIRVFDTKNREQSDDWNPLAGIKDHQSVQAFVTCLVKNTNNGKQSNDPIWDNGEILFYTAILEFMLDWCPRRDMTIARFFQMIDMAEIKESGFDIPCPLDLLFGQIETGMKTASVAPEQEGARGLREAGEKGGPKTEPSTYIRNYDGAQPGKPRIVNGREKYGLDPSEDAALGHWKEFRQGAHKTLQSFVISAHARLLSLTETSIKALLSGNGGRDQLELAMLGQSHDEHGNKRPPRVTFIIMSDFDESLNCLLSILMYQAINGPMHTADDKNHGVLPRPVSIIMDEFKNVGKMPSFPQCIAVVRSRNIDCSIILQNLSQLKEMYGENDAATIRGNCPTTVYLGGGRDWATAKQFAEESGKETITTQTSSLRGLVLTGEKTISTQTMGREVYDASEIATLSSKKALVWMGDKQVIKDAKSWCYEHKRYSKDYQGIPPAKRSFDYLSWKNAGRPLGEEALIWKREYEAECDVRDAEAKVAEANRSLLKAYDGQIDVKAEISHLGPRQAAPQGAEAPKKKGREMARLGSALAKADAKVDACLKALEEAKEELWKKREVRDAVVEEVNRERMLLAYKNHEKRRMRTEIIKKMREEERR